MTDNIIDKFVISVLFDQRGLAESTKKTETTIVDMIKNIDISFKGLLSGLAAGFSIGIGKNLVEGFAASGSRVGFLSQTLGESEEKLQIWEQAAKRAGGSVEGLDNAIYSLQQRILAASQGGDPGFAAMLEQYGLAVKNSNGGLKTSLEIFEDYHKLLQGKNNSQQQLIGKNLGIDAATIRLLGMANTEFQILLDHINQLGIQDQSSSGTEAKRKMDDLAQVWDNTKNQIGEDLYPVFAKFADWSIYFAQVTLPAIINKLRELKQEFGLTNGGLAKIAATILGLGAAIPIIIGITTGFGALATIVTTIVSPIGAIVAGLAAAYAIYEKIDIKHNIKRTPESKNIFNSVGSFSDFAGYEIKNTASQFKNNWEKVMDYIVPVIAKFKNNDNTIIKNNYSTTYGESGLTSAALNPAVHNTTSNHHSATTHVSVANVHLPSVKDPAGFVSSMQDMYAPMAFITGRKA